MASKILCETMELAKDYVRHHTFLTISNGNHCICAYSNIRKYEQTNKSQLCNRHCNFTQISGKTLIHNKTRYDFYCIMFENKPTALINWNSIDSIRVHITEEDTCKYYYLNFTGDHDQEIAICGQFVANYRHNFTDDQIKLI